MAGGRPRGPRLEIPKSRVKLAVDFLPIGFAVLAMPFGLFMMASTWRQMLLLVVWLLLVWGAVGFLRDLWRPPVLILTSTGFRVLPRDKDEIPWRDVTGFSLGGRNIRYMQWYRPVLFDYRSDRIPEPKGWLEIALTKGSGNMADGWIVGPGWDRAPEEVVKLLTSWHKRYG